MPSGTDGHRHQHVNRDSINGGMAEMAETVGFQFVMFIATLILY